MDPEMLGIFDRADELTRDLMREYEMCAQRGDVSERARNLCHEVLIKVRSALDFAMSRVFDKHTSLTGKERTKAERRAGFPICDRQSQFGDKLTRLGLSHLEDSNPDLYAKLRQVQPFSSKRADLLWLRDLTNLGKHVRLALQECHLRKAKQVRARDGSVAVFTEGVTFHGPDGEPVDPSERGVVQEVIMATFKTLHNTETITDPGVLCLFYCRGCRRYITKLLLLI